MTGVAAATTGTTADLLVLGVGYALLLATSGWVVTGVLSTVEGATPGVGGDGVASGDAGERDGADGAADATTAPTQTERDVGRIIGKCENVLVYTFVVANAFTALAVVFAAKSIVRREDMQNNSRYYLAGTLVNFTYSLVFGVVARTVVTGSPVV